MGIFGSLGLGKIGESFSGVGSGILIFLSIFFVILLVGGGVFVYYWNKSRKQVYKNKIHIFKEVRGQRIPVEDDTAREIFVPDTNISLFLLKKKGIYLARPTKSMGIDAYWYLILPNGEWVNFDLLADESGDETKAGINYDHRDTRYAYLNLKEIIKRNWKDKSTKWWKEYSPLITFVVVSFIFLVGCWFLLSQIGNLIEDLGPISERMVTIAESLERSVQIQQNINSGLVPS